MKKLIFLSLIFITSLSSYSQDYFDLGFAYLNEGNAIKALEYFKAAADQGNTNAIVNIGIMYYYGEGEILQNHKEAVKWYKRAADAGDINGCNYYGDCLMNGYGIEKNLSDAEKYFRITANKNNAIGQYYLANIIASERNEFDNAYELYSKAINNGYLPAKLQIGLLFLNEEWVQASDKKAFKHLNYCARGGSIKAQEIVADMYLNGLGTRKNEKKAYFILLDAAANKSIVSMYNLALCYKDGIGADNVDSLAFKFFKMAADTGHVQSQYELALCYEEGRGVAIDTVMAFNYYIQAAINNHIKSMYQVGYYLFEGKATPVNYDESVKWLLKAANNNYYPSQELLALCYEEGKGVPVNEEKAKMWREHAESNKAACMLQDMFQELDTPESENLIIQTEPLNEEL